MIVCRDLDLASAQIHHRLIDAAMPVAKLVRSETKCPSEEFVAETDAEERNSSPENLLQQSDLTACRSRITGSVREEDAIRLARLDIVECSGGRQNMDLNTALRHPCWRPRLDAEVDGYDPVAPPTDGGHDVRLRSRHLVGQVGPGHRGYGLNPLEQSLWVLLNAGHPDSHRTALPQVAGQRPSVDVTHADNALLSQLGVQAAPGAPIRGRSSRVADDVACYPDPVGFIVLVIPPGIADVRSRGNHDLPVVTRIGEGFLVAGHGSCEDRLTEGFADGAICAATKSPAVLEDKKRRWSGIDKLFGRARVGCEHDRPFLPHGTGLKGWLIA